MNRLTDILSPLEIEAFYKLVKSQPVLFIWRTKHAFPETQSV